MTSRLPVLVPQTTADLHVPSLAMREQVATLAGLGLNEQEIAVSLALEPLVIRRHYSQEVRFGVAITTARVGTVLVGQALRGDTNAATLYLKAKARWIVPTKEDSTSKDLTPEAQEARRKTMNSILKRVHNLEARARRASNPETASSDDQPEAQAKPKQQVKTQPRRKGAAKQPPSVH